MAYIEFNRAAAILTSRHRKKTDSDDWLTEIKMAAGKIYRLNK